MQDDHRVMPIRRRCVSTTVRVFRQWASDAEQSNTGALPSCVIQHPHQPFSQGPLPSGLRQWIALQLIPRHEYPVRLTGWRQVHQRAWSATLSFSLRQRRQRVLSIVRVAGRMGWRDTSNITTGGRFLLLLSHQGQIPIKGSK